MSRRVPSVLLAGVCALAFSASPTLASHFTVLHAFDYGEQNPESSSLAYDGQAFYGTTYWGSGGACLPSCGTVFRILPGGKETTIYTFKGGSDGAYPTAGVTFGPDGALYGTTSAGGGSVNCREGCGTVFRLTTDGKETILHAFNGRDGAVPLGAVIFDSRGNLFGTTSQGGGKSRAEGTIYRIGRGGQETLLHVFHNDGRDGVWPSTRLSMDSRNNLYGTTSEGGKYASGTVFKVASDGVETILYAFRDLSDGGFPQSDLLIDAKRNLYGTTEFGGDIDFGTVFKVTPAGVETVLHSFAGAASNDGTYPFGGVIADDAGNLYGTTTGNGGGGDGNVYRLAPDGTLKLLHNFIGTDGSMPRQTLATDNLGSLYGTTPMGGPTQCGCGTVFRVHQ